MCLTSPSAPSPAAAAAPVAPIAPLEPPKPMAAAEASSTSSAASRRGGVSQLRIQSKAAATGVPLGSGLADNAANTIAGRKSQIDAAVAASGG